MKVLIDQDQCEANGLCVGAAAEVFDLDDDDVLHLRVEHPPEGLRAKVEQAVRLCPKMAIQLEEE